MCIWLSPSGCPVIYFLVAPISYASQRDVDCRHLVWSSSQNVQHWLSQRLPIVAVHTETAVHLPFWHIPHPALIQFTSQTHFRACHTFSQPRGSCIKKAVGVGRYCTAWGVCEWVLLGLTRTKTLPYISVESIERGLGFITEQIRGVKSISNSFGFKALLTKALRFQEVIKTIWFLLLLFKEKKRRVTSVIRQDLCGISEATAIDLLLYFIVH